MKNMTIIAGLLHRSNTRKVLDYLDIKYLEQKNFVQSRFDFTCTKEQYEKLIDLLPDDTDK